MVGRPTKDDAVGAADKRLFPRDCREAVRCIHCGYFHTRVWDCKGCRSHQSIAFWSSAVLLQHSVWCWLLRLSGFSTILQSACALLALLFQQHYLANSMGAVKEAFGHTCPAALVVRSMHWSRH